MKTINRLALNGQEYFIKSGDSSPKEYVDITFASNLAGDTIDFTGKKVTVKYISDNTEYFSAQYDIVGDKATFEVPAGTYYTIEYPDGVTNHKKPDNAEATMALAGRTRVLNALYKTTKVKVQISAEDADLTGLQITFTVDDSIYPLHIPEGQNYVEYFIPWKPYTVSFGDLAGYIAPEDVSITEDQLSATKTITGTYTKSIMGLAVYTKQKTEIPVDQWRTGLNNGTYNNNNAVGIAIHTENANFVIYKGYPVQTNGAANFNLGADSTCSVDANGNLLRDGSTDPITYQEDGVLKNLKDLVIDVGTEQYPSAVGIANAYNSENVIPGKQATEILKQIYQNDENTPFTAGYIKKGSDYGKSFFDSFTGGVSGSAGKWYIGSAKEWYIASQQEGLIDALTLIGTTGLGSDTSAFTQDQIGCWTSTVVKKKDSTFDTWTYGYVYVAFCRSGFLSVNPQIAAPSHMRYSGGELTPGNWVCPFLSLDE